MTLADRDDLTILPLVVLAMVLKVLRLRWLRRLFVDLLTRVAYRCSRRRRRRIERAMGAAFSASTDAGTDPAFVRSSMRGVWREWFCLTAGPAARADFAGIRIHGLHHLREALDSGNGVILWESNGLGARWMPKRLLQEQGFMLHQVHGPNHLGGLAVHGSEATWLRRHLVRPIVKRCEAYFVTAQIYLGEFDSWAALRQIQKHLASNEIICISGDGEEGMQLIQIPFLGTEKAFATGMVNLARATGAPLLPMYCLPGGDGAWHLRLEPPVDTASGDDRSEQLRHTLETHARRLEALILEHPGEYRNWHLLNTSLEQP